jgi:glycerol-3-phosphate O-acyltransferase / dihydroxyacetone phosphate acyltransferase
VLGILPGHDGHLTPNRHRSRSQHSSYADLQKFRMSASQGKAPASSLLPSEAQESAANPGLPTEEGLHRRIHHDRKMSLSDGVAVERISALERDQVFKEGTDVLNREIQINKQQEASAHRE